MVINSLLDRSEAYYKPKIEGPFFFPLCQNRYQSVEIESDNYISLEERKKTRFLDAVIMHEVQCAAIPDT